MKRYKHTININITHTFYTKEPLSDAETWVIKENIEEAPLNIETVLDALYDYDNYDDEKGMETHHGKVTMHSEECVDKPAWDVHGTPEVQNAFVYLRKLGVDARYVMFDGDAYWLYFDSKGIVCKFPPGMDTTPLEDAWDSVSSMQWPAMIVYLES